MDTSLLPLLDLSAAFDMADNDILLRHLDVEVDIKHVEGVGGGCRSLAEHLLGVQKASVSVPGISS